MDKAVTTSIFITVGMILALMLFNVAYPAAIEGGEAITAMTDRVTERMRSQIRVIHATAELDEDGNWLDGNANGIFDVTIWVKNVGDTRIVPIEAADIFFGVEGNFGRIPHEGSVSGTYPRWQGMLENATDWNPTGTLRITVQSQAALPAGRYYFKITLPNGISDEYFLGI